MNEKQFFLVIAGILLGFAAAAFIINLISIVRTNRMYKHSHEEYRRRRSELIDSLSSTSSKQN